MENKIEFEWCYEIGQEVEGDFYDDIDDDLNENDTFIVENRDLDEEDNQWFKVRCTRTGILYDAPATSLDTIAA